MRTHWDKIYSTNPLYGVSWYQPAAELSLAWISQAALNSDDPIIDVGGGASSLVDSLLDLGYSNISVLDISSVALIIASSRLGSRADAVQWIVSDIALITLPENYRLWHDRAINARNLYCAAQPRSSAGWAFYSSDIRRGWAGLLRRLTGSMLFGEPFTRAF